MGKGDDGARWVFPLTSLQIGDLQSYLSDLNLFLAIESDILYIFVDNQPWLKDPRARPAHFWQLMVTKSRMSPFANTKARKRRKKASSGKPRQYLRWFSLLDAARLSRKRAMIPLKKLQKSLHLRSKLRRTLYGFIVFEVSWTDVRGINYLNELQTDTSLAIEAKSMRRWEFDSICQAARTVSFWFSGSVFDKQYLKEYLDAVGEVFYDAEEKTFPVDDDENIEDDIPHNLNRCSAYPAVTGNRMSPPHTTSLPSSPYKRRKLSKSMGTVSEFDFYLEGTHSKVKNSLKEQSYSKDRENVPEATAYKDILLLCRFNDPYLPFKLKQIIISDLRLLTLLETGLPSWVIFLQSYPVFCHLYRPWMCPLARALYVFMSFVTVLIGFYDLYKNVPVLKATAYRLCGPLIVWIETWEMISRVKYLGALLFLHNFQKGFRWFLIVSNTTRSSLSALAQPLASSLLNVLDFIFPKWNNFIEILEGVYSVISIVVESCCELGEKLFSPIWMIFSVIWRNATYVLYPAFCISWEILCVLIRTVLALRNFISLICANTYELFGGMWKSIRSIFNLASVSQAATVSSYEVSMWRLLWTDLFSKVFRAVRSILNGFLVFFAVCNRHRLSIYSHVVYFLRLLFGKVGQTKHVGRSIADDSS